jgi:hypothetical protein
MNEAALNLAANDLASRAGFQLAAPPEPIPGGRNNRVFRLCTKGEPLLLKQYFSGGREDRDRLAAEFSFARFAWDHGVRALPEPIVADADLQVALFAYVEGRLLQTAEVDARRVDEAINFFVEVNRHRQSAQAANLPVAAEACFSVREHLDTVDRRVKRLLDRAVGEGARDESDEAFREFIVSGLRPAWEVVQARTVAERGGADASLDLPLIAEERCLSPSDFGFHNALLTAEDRLVFHDFEYAGWDDPAKMVCDFFCQVQLPAPRECFAGVVDRVVKSLRLSASHGRRIELLLPVYRIKWCCILLNEFLEEGARRRRFAGDDRAAWSLRQEQLQKARAYLAAWQTAGAG